MMKLLPRKIHPTSLLLTVLMPFIFLYSHAMALVAIYPAQAWTVSIPEQQGMQSSMLDDIDFCASLIEIPPGIKLEAFGPEIYTKSLEKAGSHIQVISNKKISLKGGTGAYRTEIRWMWKNSILIKTILVTVYKNSKAVFVCAHPWKGTRLIELIFQSLNFK